MGCVFEPYLSATPDVHAFFTRLLFLEFTFGEAAYACQSAISWQTAVVGDPLYRPFGRAAPELHQDLQTRHSPLLAWSEQRVINLNLVKKSPVAELEKYLHDLALTEESAVLTEKLAEIYERRGKPYSSAHARLKALRLSPTPQQEVRLVLKAVTQLTEQGREVEALEALLKLLRDQPDHPDRLTFLRQAMALAKKLDRKDAATALNEEITRLEPPSPASK
jgi:tetratricopeptide (TPR) repeat protein